MAPRILGMGDVLTLVERAERQFDEKARALEQKIRKHQFTLDDFLEQMQQVRKLGADRQPPEDDPRYEPSSRA